MQRQASLETSTSLNPKDYVWGQLTCPQQQQLFGQFLNSSISLMLALQFPPGGFGSWMLPGAGRPPPGTMAACASTLPQPAANTGTAVHSAQTVPAEAMPSKSQTAAPVETTKRKSTLQVSATTGSTTAALSKTRKADPSAELPPAKVAKVVKAAAKPPPAPIQRQQPSDTAKRYAMEPLGLDDICKLFDNDQMGDYFATDAGFKACPTTGPCSDYSLDQDFCLDGLLDIETVMAEMSNQCSDASASDLLPPPAAPPGGPARSSTRAAARSKAKAKKAKAGSPKKAGAGHAHAHATPQLLQAAS